MSRKSQMSRMGLSPISPMGSISPIEPMGSVGFVFDLDGTLLDTLGDLAASVNYALRQHHMPEHPIDNIRRFVGNGVAKLIERAVPNGIDNPQYSSVLCSFREYYLEHSLDTTHPYDGIMETLTELKARGCPMAVVSNKFMTATKELVRHFFGGLIEVAIGEHEAEGIRKKPAPDTVFEALRQLGIQSSQNAPNIPNTPTTIYYIGDSDVDIMTARNSGLPCVSVLWGFRDKEFLLAHGATTLITHPSELLKVGLT